MKDRYIDCDLTPRLMAKESSKEGESQIALDLRQQAGTLQWPVFKDRTYSRYLKHFMFSFKNIYTENINSTNLMFITGPTKCGKSVLLRQNLNDFASTRGHVSPIFICLTNFLRCRNR